MQREDKLVKICLQNPKNNNFKTEVKGKNKQQGILWHEFVSTNHKVSHAE